MEQEIARILIRYPDLINLIDFEIDNEWNSIYELIGKEKNNKLPVGKIYLKELVKINRLDYDVDLIYADMSSVSEDKELAKHDLINMLNILYEEHKKDEILRKIRTAKLHVERNNVKEGEKILRSIRYGGGEKVKGTKQLMLDSVMETSGFKTGIPVIDNKMLALIKGNITSIVGMSGGMKTYFTMWLLLNILETNPDFIGLYFEKEMPAKEIGRRLLSWMIKESNMKILLDSIDNHDEALEYYEKEIENKYKDKIEDTLERFKVIPNYMFDNPYDMLKQIELYNADTWVLDYMTQINSSNVSASSSYNIKVMEAVNSLKQYSNDTESHGIIINQISKPQSDSKDKRITNAKDIEWSKNIENVSTNIWSLFYPWKHKEDFINLSWVKETGYDKRFYYILDLKNRNTGNNNTIMLKAVPEHARFEELTDIESENAKLFYKRYVREFNDKQKSKR